MKKALYSIEINDIIDEGCSAYLTGNRYIWNFDQNFGSMEGGGGPANTLEDAIRSIQDRINKRIARPRWDGVLERELRQDELPSRENTRFRLPSGASSSAFSFVVPARAEKGGISSPAPDRSAVKVIDLYARVSMALKQNPENQLIELRRWAGASGVKVGGVFVDEISSKDTRPEKEKVLRRMRLGESDGVAFVALDRWGRTMSELVLELEEFSKAGKSLISLKEGLDLSTAAGRLMANVLAAMANFERDRIAERTRLGLARARAQGKRLGRPRKTPPANLPVSTEETAPDGKTSVFPSSDSGNL